jgi:hypothetical protein
MKGDAFSALRLVLVTVFILGLVLSITNLLYQRAVLHEEQMRENKSLRDSLKPVLSIGFGAGDRQR